MKTHVLGCSYIHMFVFYFHLVTYLLLTIILGTNLLTRHDRMTMMRHPTHSSYYYTTITTVDNEKANQTNKGPRTGHSTCLAQVISTTGMPVVHYDSIELYNRDRVSNTASARRLKRLSNTCLYLVNHDDCLVKYYAMLRAACNKN